MLPDRKTGGNGCPRRDESTARWTQNNPGESREPGGGLDGSHLRKSGEPAAGRQIIVCLASTRAAERDPIAHHLALVHDLLAAGRAERLATGPADELLDRGVQHDLARVE